MKVLVTGASGYLGQALIAQLLLKGYRVLALTRTPKNSTQQNLQWVPWDGKNPAALSPLAAAYFKNIEIVVNLAGEPVVGKNWSAHLKKEIYDSRVHYTTMIADAALEYSLALQTVLSASAVGFYGDGGDRILSEESTSGKDFLSEVCVAWEAAAQRFKSQKNVSVSSLRTGIVLGKNAGALARMLPAFKWGLGGRLGSGKQWMSWIHEHDYIAALLFLIEKKINGPVNLVAPGAVRNLEFTQTLAHVLHRPAVFAVPSFALKTAFGEGAEVLLGGQRAEPQVLLKNGFQFKYPTLEMALQNLLIES